MSTIVQNPWGWRISARPWFVLQASRLARWKPDPTLNLSPSVPYILADAALREEAWVYHPFLSAVTLDERHRGRDLRLAVWAAVHAERDHLFDSLVVEQPTWMWGADGGSEIKPGRYDVRELAGRFRESDDNSHPVALDLWIDTVGLPLPDGIVDYERWSWAHSQPLLPEDEVCLRREVVSFLVAVDALATNMPECASWVSAITRVVVPLRGTPETRFRSGSTASIPGLVFTDIDGPVEQVLESLVHESAHHWFCLAEAAGPLVEPTCNATYKSPLRSDPRPLRGVFLAFHALAFMAAFYRDSVEVRSGVAGIEKMLDSVRKLRDDACATVRTARSELTDRGRDILDQTMELVVAYAG